MQQSLDNILISISHTHTRAPSVIHFKKIICLANSDNNNHLNWNSNRNWITMMANERNLNEECVCALLQNWNVCCCFFLLSVTDSDYITLIISESAFLWKPWSWKKTKPKKFVCYIVKHFTAKITCLCLIYAEFWTIWMWILIAILKINLDW